MMEREAAAVIAGNAAGLAVVLARPLSFWGGIDVATGRIIDATHPNRGETVTGRILVMPGGRGSSSSSSVLAEAIRRKTAPAGIILARPDAILAVGAIVADMLYALRVPLVIGDTEDLKSGLPTEIRDIGGNRCVIRQDASANGIHY
jgi:predicted aconitase with swiveling domain